MTLTPDEMHELVDELRTLYAVAAANGHTPSAAYIKLGRWLKAGGRCPRCQGKGQGVDDDAEALYQETDRETMESWLEAVETNIEMAGRGGTGYSDKEVEFVNDMRVRLEETTGQNKPLTGRQLRWLKALYDRS